MADSWHECISDELDSVEDVMNDVIRSDNPELVEMCKYVLAHHGKRIRPAICILSFYACGGTDPKRAINVGAAVELIHNATLVHDDINDNGDMRRGAKALYKEYSLGKSVVAGDYMYALGFRLLGSSSSEIVDYVIEAASDMGSGEFSQKKYERNTSVGENDYMKIISGKTAGLIECAAKCGAFIATPDDLRNIESAGNFAFKAGQAFQIVDDVLDVIGDSKVTGKRAGNDIVECKPTLPIIYAMQDPSVGKRVGEIFEDENSDYDDAAEAISLIEKTDSIERCLKKARDIAAEAVSYLDFAKESVYKNSLVSLVNFFVSRDR